MLPTTAGDGFESMTSTAIRTLAIATLAILAGGCGDDSGPADPLTADNYSAELLWKQRYDSTAGGERGLDYPAGMVAADGVVVVSGRAGTSYDYPNYLVRAYDGAAGALLWEDRITDERCESWAYSMVVLDGRLFVGGWVCSRSLLRAYDLHTGEMLWEDALSGEDSPSEPVLQIADGRLVSIVQTARHPVVRAYAPTDGTLLWQTTEEEFSHGGLLADRSTVAVVGSLSDDASTYRYGFRARDAASGALRWTWDVNDFHGAPIGRGYRTALGHGTLLEYIETRDAPVSSWLIARDSTTGETIWEKRVSLHGTVSDIVIGPEQVHVVGVSGLYDAGCNCWRNQFYVASFDTASGAPLWRDERGSRGDEEARRAVLTGRRLLVDGFDKQLRVYDAITGDLVEEIIDLTIRGRTVAIAADGDRFYALGEAFGEQDSDFLLRAFRDSTR